MRWRQAAVSTEVDTDEVEAKTEYVRSSAEDHNIQSRPH